MDHSEVYNNVRHRQASVNTILHCLYAFFFLGYDRSTLAKIFGKSKSVVCKWIRKYKSEGTFTRKQRKQVYRQFGERQRQWLLDLYFKEPVLYLDEACRRFQKQFNSSISRASVVRILHSSGLTWKKIERRAIQIRKSNIQKFADEMDSFQWHFHQLVFLDEVSYDSRDMLRNKGYGVKGKKVRFMNLNLSYF